MKRVKLIGASIAALIGVAAVSVALAAASGTAKAVHSHKAAAREAPATTDGDGVQQGDQTSPDSGVAVKLIKAGETTAADGDSVQAGDQTSPDTGHATRSESTGEAASSESAPSDGPGGFADTSATADTQQQGAN